MAAWQKCSLALLRQAMHDDNMHLVGISAQQTSSLTAVTATASSLQLLLAVLVLTFLTVLVY